MTGLFISIDDYLEDPVEFEVQRAIKYLKPIEEYDIYPSRMNSK